VKGAKAGWKAGRRLESLPHNNSVHHKEGVSHKSSLHHCTGREKLTSRPPARSCRCGTQDCVLHGEGGVASLAACSTGPHGA